MNDTLNNALGSILATAVKSTFKTGARFVSLKYTTEAGKTAIYNLLMGVRLEPVYKSDLRSLRAKRRHLTGVDLVACDELIASLSESLVKGIGNNSAYTLKGYFEHVAGTNGEVKLHVSETGEVFLYLRGYVVKETVLVEGEYKPVKSSDKTLAKKKLEKNMKRGKIRTFKINVNQLHAVKMNGKMIEIS